jgi:hypothetical protein
MTPETYPPLAALLRSTLHLVKYYGANDAHRADLAELTSELQRTIATIEAKETNGKPTGIPPGFPNSH